MMCTDGGCAVLAASETSTNLGAGLAALLVVAWVLSAERAQRSFLTAPLVFTFAGFALGGDAFGLVDFKASAKLIETLAEVTLAIVLFSDAAKVGGPGIERYRRLPIRMLGIGLPLIVAGGVLIGLVLFPDTPWASVALLAAVLAPTDAALGQEVVTDESVPERLRTGLSIESGLNDGFAVPIATVFFGIARADAEAGDPSSWVAYALEQIGYGAVVGLGVGIAGAFLGGWSMRSGWASRAMLDVGLLALAIGAWALAGAVGGNGFIAAFVAGIAVAARGPMRHAELEFVEREGQLLVWLTFLAFGGLLVGPALDDVDAVVVVYVVASLTVVRMVPIAISLIGTGESPLAVGFLGWFGPRGLASIALGLQALLAERSPVGDEFAQVLTLTVVASVVLHGVSARPAARRLGPRMADHSPTDRAPAS